MFWFIYILVYHNIIIFRYYIWSIPAVTGNAGVTDNAENTDSERSRFFAFTDFSHFKKFVLQPELCCVTANAEKKIFFLRVSGNALGNKRISLGNKRTTLGNKRTTLGNKRTTLGNKRTTEILHPLLKNKIVTIK